MKIKTNISLKELTTLNIGGKAKYFVEVTTLDEMLKSLNYANENNLRVFILGKGSNILFDDRGINALVIHNKINFLELSENSVLVGAGYSFSKLGYDTAKRELSGLEFAFGIPGSVGGAIFMNASAHRQCVSDCLISVSYITQNLKLIEIQKEDLNFNYRHSSFHEMKGSIVSARFLLKKSKETKQYQRSILKTRRESQPLDKKSAGCIFKNPTDHSAGELIDRCNLKNKTIGGAKVSDLHGNFIINENNASCLDFLKLIEYVKEEVKRKTNIVLKQEIRYIPYEI